MAYGEPSRLGPMVGARQTYALPSHGAKEMDYEFTRQEYEFNNYINDLCKDFPREWMRKTRWEDGPTVCGILWRPHKMVIGLWLNRSGPLD